MLRSPYQINNHNLAGWLIADRPKENPRFKRLKYHIKKNDYFGTLATVLDLINQNAEENGHKLEELKNDLLLLQKDYKIVRKK